jgi:hypothetical protein
MDIIFGIFKFLVVSVYILFLIDSMLNIKSQLFDLDNEDKDRDPFSWFDVVYFAYAFFNVIFIVKFLHV